MISSSTKARARICCLTLLFLIFGSYGASLAQSDLASKKVLILHSFGYAQPAYRIIDASLQGAFIASGLDFNNLYFEFMDLARNPGLDYRKDLMDVYRQKFKERKIDLIVALHTEALYFIVEDARDVFPGIPVISVLGPPRFEYSDPKRPVIILPFSIDTVATAKAIMALKPDTRKLALIAGSSLLDRRFEARVQSELQAWPARPEVESISDLPLSEMLARVGNLPSGTALLYTTVYADSTGKTFMPPDVARMICAAANAPAFGLFETLLGDNGIVGGIVLDHRVEGQRAVRIAMDILQGSLPREPISILPAPLTPMFDWQQMKRWGFDEAALPAGSIVLNKPVSVWDQYKLIILGTVIFILLESALLVALFLQIRRKNIAEQSLKKAEEKYRRIFDGALEGIFESSPGGKFLTANATLSKILGYDSPEELTSSIGDLGREVWVNEHERQEYVQRLERQGVVLKHECQFRRRDGTSIWVSLSTRRATTPDGQTFYSGFVEDITGRTLIESETQRLREDLAHVTRVSTLGELTSSLAHEINQPLAAILSNAQAAQRFLSQDNPDMKEVTEILGDIIRDDNRAAEVIRKIRSLLKKEEARYELLSLNDVIEEILNVVRDDAALAAVSIEKEFDPSLPSVWGDRIQLQQVILNLVLNAAEAMKDSAHDSRRLTVTTMMKDGRFAEVSIRDSGPGIEENSAGRLFEPFYTTKSGGIGMGLAISQTIVRSHKGEIWAENSKDGGATFSFTVPFDSGVRP